MGKHYPPLDRSQVESILKKAGFYEKRHKASSHSQWEGHVDGVRRIVTVDHLGGSLKEKYGHRLINKMIQQSGMTKDAFYSLMK